MKIEKIKEKIDSKTREKLNIRFDWKKGKMRITPFPFHIAIPTRKITVVEETEGSVRIWFNKGYIEVDKKKQKGERPITVLIF